jgi:hypothetical protein
MSETEEVALGRREVAPGRREVAPGRREVAPGRGEVALGMKRGGGAYREVLQGLWTSAGAALRQALENDALG